MSNETKENKHCGRQDVYGTPPPLVSPSVFKRINLDEIQKTVTSLWNQSVQEVRATWNDAGFYN